MQRLSTGFGLFLHFSTSDLTTPAILDIMRQIYMKGRHFITESDKRFEKHLTTAEYDQAEGLLMDISSRAFRSGFKAGKKAGTDNVINIFDREPHSQDE